MKYNERYDRWVSKDGFVYRYSKSQKRLIKCNLSNTLGYLYCHVRCKDNIRNYKRIRVNKLVWETFVGDIPDGYELDHINTIKTDNCLDNLKLVTHKENMNNPITRENISKVRKGWNPSPETRNRMSIAQRKRFGSLIIK